MPLLHSYLAGLLLLTTTLNAQPLPRSVPEAEGVSSAAINRFLDSAAISGNEFHSIMILRHGKVIAEGWWNPYGSSLRHTLYSTSKSFTSTAVGFAVSEGKLNVNDKIISFFKKDLPDSISARLASLTVKDVLSMSDGMDPDRTPTLSTQNTNWIRAFLATPILYQPGSKFLYNSMGTFMLSAIVQQVTGQKEVDYLRPRLFDPLGIHGMDWEENLQGINTGGWGLRITTEDMAKLGQLYLRKGLWNGKQVLPAAWVQEATTTKIIQHPDLPQIKKDSSDWEQGYCYQFWRCRHNAFRADGAFGQYIIVMPDQDAVIAITSETANMQSELNLVWKYLLPAMRSGTLKPDPLQTDKMKRRLDALALPLALHEKDTLTNLLNGKRFIFQPNDRKIDSYLFETKDSSLLLSINTGNDTYTLNFGSGAWKTGKTNMPGPSLTAPCRENNALLMPYKVAGSYAWKDPHTLELTLRYIESPHTLYITCHIDRGAIESSFAASNDYGKKIQTITGVLK